MLCSTDERPIILTGSSSKFLTHYWSSGSGQVRACNVLVNGDQALASRNRLKKARKVCASYLEELAKKKLCKVQEAKSI